MLYIKLYKGYSQYERGQLEPYFVQCSSDPALNGDELERGSRCYLNTLLFKRNAQALMCVKTVCLVLSRPSFC